MNYHTKTQKLKFDPDDPSTIAIFAAVKPYNAYTSWSISRSRAVVSAPMPYYCFNRLILLFSISDFICVIAILFNWVNRSLCETP